MQSCINQHTLTKTTQQLAFHPNKHPIAQAKRKVSTTQAVRQKWAE
jgi:hypothetical protein